MSATTVTTRKNVEMLRRQAPVYGMQEGGMAPMAMPPQGMMPAAPPAAMPEMAQAQQAGMDPAILEQMLSQASQGIMALDEAEDYEQVMNSMRETDATIEERRMELADIVGEQDAQQTPESVLTLVQPVMMMAKVDEGIGGLAQGAMTEPVTGDMAGGIMSTVNMGAEEGPAPVNFNQGGVVGMRMGGDPFTAPPANMLKSPLQQEYELQRNFYGQLLDKDAQTRALQGQQDLTQAQMLFDLAQTGLAIAAPGPQRMSLAEKLAYAAQQTELFPKIGARAADLGKFKQEQEQESRKFDLAAAQGAMDLRNLGIQEGYDIEKERIKQEADIEKEQIEQKAQSERDAQKTYSGWLKDVSLKNADYQANPRQETYIDQNAGVEVVYQTTNEIITGENPENIYDVRVDSTSELLKGPDGKVLVKAGPDIETMSFMDVNGNQQLYSRKKNVIGSAFEPVTGPEGKPLYTDIAALKWETRTDPSGKKESVLVNTKTGTIQESYTLPDEFEFMSVKDGNYDVKLAVNKRTKAAEVVFSGSPKNETLTVDGQVLKYDPVSEKITTLYTAPGKPVLQQITDGRLAYVYPPDPNVPGDTGREVPIHNSVAKAQTYSYENWNDVEGGRSYVFFRVNNGKDVYYVDQTDAEGNPKVVDPRFLAKLIPISDDTANAAATAGMQRLKRQEKLKQTRLKLLISDIDKTPTDVFNERVAPDFNPNLSIQERADARDFVINNLEEAQKLKKELESEKGDAQYIVRNNINLAEQIEKGTGFWNNLKASLGTAGAAIFGMDEPFWAENIYAKQAVRAIMLNFRMAAANSPRVAEGEQVRLASIMADVDKWMTTGKIELNKVRLLKDQFIDELVYVQERLADGTEKSKPVLTALEQSEVALEQAVNIMDSIIPYSQSGFVPTEDQKTLIESKKRQQR
jgi:hypothetical protein